MPPAGRTTAHYIERGHLRVVHDERNDVLIPTNDLDDHPDIRPADPLDPHPLAKISCALGAMADLIRDSHDHGPLVLQGHGEIAGATQHVLSLAAVADRHCMTHGPAGDAVRPLLIGRYAERVIDSLHDLTLQPISLDQLAAVAPQQQPATPPDQLEAALEAWRQGTREELGRLIPSVEVLRQITNRAPGSPSRKQNGPGARPPPSPAPATSSSPSAASSTRPSPSSAKPPGTPPSTPSAPPPTSTAGSPRSATSWPQPAPCPTGS